VRVESHTIKKAVASLRVFCNPTSFPVLVNQAEFCFEDRDRSGDKYKGEILVERQSTEAARREWIDGAEQGDMGSFPVLRTISAPYGSIT
jgi:hypothetical protein